jgi:hypothetical protein
LLRFRLRQLYVPSLGRYFLPLPKLTEAQVNLLTAHLERRGFSIHTGSAPGKRVATRGPQRISIDGALGLASSAADMLDAVAPSVPSLLESRNRVARAGADAAGLYFSTKRSGASAELQLFPRMESLRTWSCLRRDGLCGLTPDEAAVLKHLLRRASGSSSVECVTARPRQGSRAIQEGRRLYYRSVLPVTEFLASLRSIDSDGADSATYLPRNSLLSLAGTVVDARIPREELGEWCFAA